MPVWPEMGDEAVPSPGLVAVMLVLDQLPAERVPWWATAWLAGGLGGRATAEIAGLDGSDTRQVRDLLPEVFAELSESLPATGAAAATLVLIHMAELCLRELASEFWIVQRVEEIVSGGDCPDDIRAQPLGRLTAWPMSGARAGAGRVISSPLPSGTPAGSRWPQRNIARPRPPFTQIRQISSAVSPDQLLSPGAHMGGDARG